MILNMNMLGLGMKLWILGKKYDTLTVTVESTFLILLTQLLQGTQKPNHLDALNTKTYLASIVDNAIVFYKSEP